MFLFLKFPFPIHIIFLIGEQKQKSGLQHVDSNTIISEKR